MIRSIYPELKAAYIIDWIPEQGEDIYKLLINDNIILVNELDRFNVEIEPIVESKSIPQYLQGLSKYNQIKLGVALDLAKNSNGKLIAKALIVKATSNKKRKDHSYGWSFVVYAFGCEGQ